MTLLLIFILGLTLVQLGRLYFERQGARELSITLLSDVSRLEPGQTLTLTLILENKKRMSVPHVSARILFPAILECLEPDLILNDESMASALVLHTTLAGRQKKTRTLKFIARQRGAGEFRVTTSLSDYLSLTQLDGPQAQPRLCIVHPLRQFPSSLAAHPCGLQGQRSVRRWLYPDPIFYTGVRPYQPQDSFRDIDWRATARYQSLYVKEYDHTSDPAFSIFLILQSIQNLFADDAEFMERAVQFAAAMLDQSQRQQLPTALVTNAVVRFTVADTSVCDHSLNHTVSCLDLLACAAPYPLSEPTRLFQRYPQLLDAAHHCLLILNTLTEPLQEWVMKICAQGTAVTLVCWTLPDLKGLPENCDVLSLRKEERE